MAKLRWLPQSRDDLDRLLTFLKSKNPEAAGRAVETIVYGANLLGRSPHAGRPMNDGTERRELFIPFGGGAYVLRYRLDRDSVIVLRVWHGRGQRF